MTDNLILLISLKAMEKFPKIRSGYMLNLFFSSIKIPINFVDLVSGLVIQGYAKKIFKENDVYRLELTSKGLNTALKTNLFDLIVENRKLFIEPDLVFRAFKLENNQSTIDDKNNQEKEDIDCEE